MNKFLLDKQLYEGCSESIVTNFIIQKQYIHKQILNQSPSKYAPLTVTHLAQRCLSSPGNISRTQILGWPEAAVSNSVLWFQCPETGVLLRCS